MPKMKKSDWFKNSIIYHVLIDRFAGFNSIKDWDNPKFLGGNVRGIINKLDYLKNLGINTIWISPFYKTTEYHGYHITDFFRVDSHFGDEEDIKELIKSAHEMKLKIIVDFVPNHCSIKHPFFIDAQKNRNSNFKNWFYFNKWPNEYLSFLSIKEIPKLNLDNIETRDYIINAAKYWLNFGFDGFRLDHVIGSSMSFWNKFNNEIKKQYPTTVLIGEAWMKGIKFKELKTIKIPYKFIKWLKSSSSDNILKEYVDVFDGALDFKFQELIRLLVAYNQISYKKYSEYLEEHYLKFPQNFYLPNFLDNHDMNRFLFECNNNKNKLKKAAEYQFMVNQPIIIYYGTEIGLTQNKSIWNLESHGDLQTRMPMIWRDYDENLLNYYKDLIKKRINKSL